MKIVRCTKCMAEIGENDRLCPYCGCDQQSGDQPSSALSKNTILHGRYLVGNVIGQGGFGITYVGYDLTLEMKVAVKEYFPSGSAMRTGSVSDNIQWDFGENDEKQWEDGIERFLKEARRMARLDSVPSVVRVRDAFRENQTAYIVMDFVEGMTLKNYLLSHGILRWDECLRLMGPILDSLAVIHDNGFIHRDISPDNIMLQPDGTARLLDMGAAMDVQASGGHASMVVVKRNFSAPEQYLESESLGSWTDVYSMAATIYYCLTGRVVPEAMEREFKKTPLQFPPEPGIPQNVKEAITAGLELHAEERIRDMRELKRRMTGVGSEPPRPSEPSGQFEPYRPMDALSDTSSSADSPRPNLPIQPTHNTGTPKHPFVKEKPGKKRKMKLVLAVAVGLTVCVIGAGMLGSGSGQAGAEEASTAKASIQENNIGETSAQAVQTSEASTEEAAAQIFSDDENEDFVNIDISELTYRKGEDGGYIITAYSGMVTGKCPNLAFPDEINGIAVTQLGENMSLLSDGEIALSEGLMANNTVIEKVHLPKGLIKIESAVFYKCTSLTEVKLPDSLEEIDMYVFYDCVSLANLDLPEGLKAIGVRALEGTAIRELTIPSSLKSFLGYPMLETVKVSEGNEYYFVEDGVLFEESASKSLVLVSILKKGDYVVPEGVKSIDSYAFTGSQITSVTVPSSVDEIGNSAFFEAEKLQKVEIMEGTKEIGSFAFSRCTQLSEIIIPKSVKVIDYYAFSRCPKLSYITVSRDCLVKRRISIREPGPQIQYYD